METTNNKIFDVLLSLTVIGIIFILASIPYLVEAFYPVPEQKLEPYSIKFSLPSVEVPDVSLAFEVKANKEQAKATIDAFTLIMDRVEALKEEDFPALKYIGVFYVTMYSAVPEQCGNSLGITYSGKKVTMDSSCRTIAVDTSVIPLGTKLVVEGFEGIVWEACDTGSAINGYDLDLYTDDVSESNNFNPVYLDAWIVLE